MAIIDQNTGQIVQTPSTYTPPTPTVVNTSVPAPTAATVYSAPNITSAITSPTQAPNLSDPYGLYDQYMNSPEIQAAQQAVAQGQQQINAVNQGLRTTTTALQNQNEQALGGTGASVNLIGRQVGRARELTANELAALGETQAANVANLATLRETAGQRYQIAQQERAQLQDLIRSTGGNAGISFSDSYETALAKASKYEKEQEKEAKKTAYKDSLKEQLRALGLKTSGSTKELEKRLKKEIKSQKDYEKQIKELDLKAKQKSTGSSAKPNELKATADAFTRFGGDWQKTADYLANQGYDVSSGSNIDNELRRRAGLSPISKGGSGTSAETQKLMDQLGVSQSVAEALIKQELGL